MINFERFVLDNGLKVIVHQDKSTPIVAFNLLYDVGARDEDPSRTGFAHLFEHLMFGGSVNIADYDEVVEKSGGQNNILIVRASFSQIKKQQYLILSYGESLFL